MAESPGFLEDAPAPRPESPTPADDDSALASECLGLLERGDRKGAAHLLETRFASGSAPGPDALDGVRLAYRLHRLLESPAGTPIGPVGLEPVSDSPWGRVCAALDHAWSAVAALQRGKVDELHREAAAAVTLLPDGFPWIGLYLASVMQGVYRFTADAQARSVAVEMCSDLADRVDLPHVAISARSLLATVHLMAGELPASLRLCDSALELASSTGQAGHPVVALAHQFKGYVLLEWNQIDDAERSLLAAWTTARPEGRSVRSGVARVLTDLYDASGREQEADDWFARLSDLVREPMTLRNREWLAAVRIRRLRRTGGLQAMEEWLGAYRYSVEELVEMQTGDVVARLHELDQVLTVLEYANRWEELAVVASIVRSACGGERMWFTVRAMVSESVAAAGLGRTTEAEDQLRQAIRASVRGRFVRIFLDGGPERAALLARVCAEPIPSARAADGGDGAATGQAEAHRTRIRAAMSTDPTPGLTDRQLEVVGLLAEGHSNKAIAKSLGLSITTVKTHLRATYRQLDVSSRTQAVARARDLGIL